MRSEQSAWSASRRLASRRHHRPLADEITNPMPTAGSITRWCEPVADGRLWHETMPVAAPETIAMTDAATPAARLAATVLLLRDGSAGLEVFMVVRHQQIDFASGALVFPGGKLADGDRDPRLPAHCTGAQGLDTAALALRVAALREAFEESGVLLARPRGSSGFVASDRLDAIGARWRKPLDRGEAGIVEMLEAEDLVLAIDALRPFAHWITPTFMAKRFDTHFFLAVAPAEQVAGHDGREMVDSRWLTPATALADAAAGRCTLVPATELNVALLGEQITVASALAAAAARRIVPVLPELVGSSATGRVLRIPADAGYAVSEFPLPGPA